MEPEKVRLILGKFFMQESVAELYGRLDKGVSPYDGYLLECDLKSCESCPYHSCCTYDRLKEIIAVTGERYSQFTDGQMKEKLAI